MGSASKTIKCCIQRQRKPSKHRRWNLAKNYNISFSFGMIVSEVCTRDHPFADLLLEKDDIIQLIKKQKNDNALRVSL